MLIMKAFALTRDGGTEAAEIEVVVTRFRSLVEVLVWIKTAGLNNGNVRHQCSGNGVTVRFSRFVMKGWECAM